MAESRNIPILSRRNALAGAAAALAATVPVVAAQAAVPIDPRALVDHCAKQLAAAMNGVCKGRWEIIIKPGLAMILDRAWQEEKEGPLLADDTTGTTDYADWDRRQRHRKAVRS